MLFGEDLPPRRETVHNKRKITTPKLGQSTLLSYVKTMISLSPIFLAMLYAFIAYRFSLWRSKRELDAKSTLLRDPCLDRLCRQMAKALDVERIAVHIHEIEPINGLAAADGRIFITRGFYRRFQQGDVTGEELSSVIAHELGHVALGHARQRMIDFSGQNALRVALGTMLGRMIPGLGIWIANLLTALLAAKLSRRDEYEADAWAAALLVKSGIGIDPQISLFNKLSALTQSGAAGSPTWLMSHPKTENRIQALQTLRAKWQNKH